MRILVIEHDRKLAHQLQQCLIQSGYVVDVIRGVADGRRFAVEGDYDAVLLDAALPAQGGFEVLAALRQKRDTPVLMLTHRDRVEDRVRSLQQGADDCIAKPIVVAEMLARLEAMLRRGPPNRRREQDRLELGDLELDLTRLRAYRGGHRLELTAQEVTLLGVLLRNQGHVLSRAVLTEQVWGVGRASDTNFVDVAVRRLRAKLDGPFPDKLLHTVRGMGYVLERRGHVQQDSG